MAAQEHTTSIEEKLVILRNSKQHICKNLIPSAIVSGLSPILTVEERRHILEREDAGHREDAARILLDIVIREEDRGMNVFLDVLRREGNNSGWPSILQPLDNVAEINTDAAAIEYYSYIIQLLAGDIIDKLTDNDLVNILLELRSNQAFDDYEYEIIEARIINKGRHNGALQLFTLLGMRDPQWPLKFFLALRNSKSNLYEKIAPYEDDPVVSKTSTEDGTAASGRDCGDAKGGEEEQEEQTVPKHHLVSPERPTDTEQQETREPAPSELQLSASALERASREVRIPPSHDAASFDGACGGPRTADADADADADDGGDGRAYFSDEEKYNTEESEKSQHGKAAGTSAPRDLELRNYQYELAENGLNGINTIICAPTGSGKTRVALHIVQKHLEGQHRGETRKVVFLARTVPLVSQQHRNFREYLPNYRCELVTGESENSMTVHHRLEKNHILVLTPKVLENHLTPDKIRSLSAFSLIIFDECHHTRKGEPYNSVMKHYLRSKKRGERGLPQIVGLTASIGVEKATTTKEARESILGIMGNLDVNVISQVVRYKDELLDKVPRPEEELMTLESRENDDISNAIMNVMEKIIEQLLQREQRVKTDSEVEEVRRLLSKRENDLKSQKFGQWAVTLRNQARLLLRAGTPRNEVEAQKIMARQAFSWEVQMLAEWLVAYNEAFDVHDLTCPEDVLHYLERKSVLQREQDKQFISMELDQKLLTYFAKVKKQLDMFKGQKNPNLKVLETAIVNHIDQASDDEEGFRILVFVRTRATCRALCRWLNSHDVDEHLRSLNAQYFTGTGAHQEHGGMTPYEQVETLTRFKQGAVKLLVTTSVGEEGIDIAECNLTIRYNHVGNEVSTVQTRGRSRKRGGRSILMAMPKIIEQEELNQRREQLMNEALEQIRIMPQHDIRQFVETVQTRALEVDEIDTLMKKVKQMKAKADFSIACPQCYKVKVDGSKIRSINNAHRVIIGHDINDEVIIYPGRTIMKKDDWEMKGQVICKCKARLGQLLYYKKATFILVSPKYWVFLDKDGNPSAYKKWTQVPHQIAEVSAADIKTHLGQDDDSDGEDALGAVAAV